jgi:hypothetical protein
VGGTVVGEGNGVGVSVGGNQTIVGVGVRVAAMGVDVWEGSGVGRTDGGEIQPDIMAVHKTPKRIQRLGTTMLRFVSKADTYQIKYCKIISAVWIRCYPYVILEHSSTRLIP